MKCFGGWFSAWPIAICRTANEVFECLCHGWARMAVGQSHTATAVIVEQHWCLSQRTHTHTRRAAAAKEEEEEVGEYEEPRRGQWREGAGCREEDELGKKKEFADTLLLRDAVLLRWLAKLQLLTAFLALNRAPYLPWRNSTDEQSCRTI